MSAFQKRKFNYRLGLIIFVVTLWSVDVCLAILRNCSSRSLESKKIFSKQKGKQMPELQRRSKKLDPDLCYPIRKDKCGTDISIKVPSQQLLSLHTYKIMSCPKGHKQTAQQLVAPLGQTKAKQIFLYISSRRAKTDCCCFLCCFHDYCFLLGHSQ